MPSPDTIVTESQVAEVLGTTKPVVTEIEPLAALLATAVNVTTFTNSLGKWASIRDLERMMRSFAAANPPIHALCHSVADQLVAAAGLDPRPLKGVM